MIMYAGLLAENLYGVISVENTAVTFYEDMYKSLFLDVNTAHYFTLLRLKDHFYTALFRQELISFFIWT